MVATDDESPAKVAVEITTAAKKMIVLLSITILPTL